MHAHSRLALESETDVDFFSVTVSPATLLRIHPAGCYVSLVAMAPESRDLDKYTDWVFFAESKCRLAFEPQFKLPLIERLGQAPQHATLLASPHARTLSYGTLRLDTAVVVEALQDIGCQSVRVSAYGIKVPIDHFADPAALEAHPLQDTNIFDIGRTIFTGRLTTIAPKSAKDGTSNIQLLCRWAVGMEVWSWSGEDVKMD